MIDHHHHHDNQMDIIIILLESLLLFFGYEWIPIKRANKTNKKILKSQTNITETKQEKFHENFKIMIIMIRGFMCSMEMMKKEFSFETHTPFINPWINFFGI